MYSRESRTGLLFVTPFLLVSAVFIAYPIIDTVRVAFYRKHPFRPISTFVGLDNLKAVLQDPLFWQSLEQAAVWTLSSIVLQVALGLSIALLLNNPLAGINIFRGALLFPYLVPTVVIALVWRWVFNPEMGVVNYVLRSIGLIDTNVQWFADPRWAMVLVILLNVWKYTPFVIVTILARLQTIPAEIFEAAKVDGASAWRQFADITLPLLKRVLAVIVIFRTIWTFNKFEEIFLVTRGGPGTSTYNLALYAYEQAITNLQIGVGAAVGIYMLLILLAGSLVYLKLFRFDEEGEA